MNLFNEAELISFGRKIGSNLEAPAVIELIGDVGAGKTTLTRGIAEGLGIKEPVTSPSFTISKRYAIPSHTGTKKPSANSDNSAREQSESGFLIHYDFYRLPDPGLMSEELAEALADSHNIIILEWAESVADVLPENHLTYRITINDDGSRRIEEEHETLS